MITGIKKTHKTTEIYFDEVDEWTTVITYNTSLKNRLLAFSQEYPELCKIVSDDECGCLQFKIQKRYFTYRISAPYSEERKAKARIKMQELNANKWRCDSVTKKSMTLLLAVNFWHGSRCKI